MIVDTKNGKVRGFENTSIAGGKKYFSFLGIPYAKPPVDDLRFLAPQPVEDWDDIYDATQQRERCLQDDTILGGGLDGSEDCLHLNIHTPDPNPTALKPVLFWLHGGGFLTGSGESDGQGADYLTNYDVILVSINFRLHILGFLNLGIPECPGNAGLKDQVMALQWLKENIKAFGGDPNNITIAGCSAGASSVNYLMISPLSKGLFHKAILQSGTALSPWGFRQDTLKWAFKTGEVLGFEGDDRLELLRFFKALPGRLLAAAVLQILIEIMRNDSSAELTIPFCPSVEVIKEGAFLPEHPLTLAKTATPVPCIAGYNKVERVCITRYFMNNLPQASESMIKEIVESNFEVTETQLEHIDKELCRLYFEENDPDKSNLEKIDEFLTDVCCFYFYDALEFVTKSNIPLYIYHFTYFSENSRSHVRKMMSHLFPLTENPYHGEEYHYLLAVKKYGQKPFEDSKDLKVQNNMCQLWVNFMRTGNPTNEIVKVIWKPHTEEEPHYLQIDADLALRNEKISGERFKILKQLLRDIKKKE